MEAKLKKRIEKIREGEVPKGYKSERGYLIPASWKLCKFNDMFTRLTRKNNIGSDNVLTISAQQGLIIQREYYNHSYASENKEGYYLLKLGDFAYNKSYSDGYPYGAIKRLEKYEEGIVSPLYICFTPNIEICSDFFAQYFNGGLYNREIYKIAQEGARNHGLLNIAVKDFFSGNILCPPTAEQEKVTEILAQCDKVIELKKQLIEEKKRQKKWLMQNLFNPDSGVRLPGFKEEWDNKILQDIVTMNKEKIDPQDTSINYRCIELEHIEGNSGIILGWTNSIEQLSMKTVFKKGDILFGKLRPYLRKVSIATFDGVCSSEIWVFKIQPTNNNFFIMYSLQLDRFISAANITTGTKMPRADWNLLCDYPIALPSIREQTAIANILKTADREIDLLEQELTQWQFKKKSLMQLLLKGLVRVNI